MTRAFRIYDPLLFVLATFATLAGFFFVFDAGYPKAMAADRTFIPGEFKSQVIASIVALILGLASAALTPRRWKKLSLGFSILVLAGLFLVLKFGAEHNGARRWIFGVQPAEFAKLATVLFMAAVFADRELWPKRMPRRKDFPQWLDTVLVPKIGRALPAVIVLVGVLAIEKEPDLGTAAVVGTTAFMMFFPGRVSWKSIVAAVALASAGGYVMVHGQAYRMGRILNHAQRWEKANAASVTFQTDQAELAEATGGVIGVGVGNGQAKHVLPEATTDFIMVTVAEETGLVGSLAVLFLIGGIVWRLYWQAMRAKDRYSMLVLYGVATWIGIQACVNVMMANAFLPAIGIPFPFISYGGSSLVALWLALGACQSAINPAPVADEEKVVASSRNRRRHRRPRLSRA